MIDETAKCAEPSCGHFYASHISSFIWEEGEESSKEVPYCIGASICEGGCDCKSFVEEQDVSTSTPTSSEETPV